ncbi:hypothetical protein DM02DRAFT_266286 [Periconia macrospinosa]|uniref:Zn(2)-C6 fungal-type domain-containing protein n=1 Tax=Periconia macrospinosa TaxID=97972 RepID=A0A2V1D421_9PLEO|nr:hypothetical protein DM02DRAFT_266286 [Periconia macrospinosa]
MDKRPPPPKLAILRLAYERKSPQNRHSKSRAQKACNNCRKRKVKCSGERPRCRDCVNQHVPCIYSQARKDRLRESVSGTPLTNPAKGYRPEQSARCVSKRSKCTC